MEDLFISLFGKPEGIILSQLIAACRFTIYLSLIAFIGGGILGGLITLLRIIPSKFLNNIKFCICLVVSISSTLNAFIFIGFRCP